MLSPFHKAASPAPVTAANLSDFEWQGLDSCIIAIASLEPPAGRRIACLSCRRAKKRCDHKWPRCTTCEFSNAQCYYPRPVTRRRPKRNLSKVAQKNDDGTQDIVVQHAHAHAHAHRPRSARSLPPNLPPILTCTRATVGSTRADPFSSFPIPMKENMHFLLNHFATDLTSVCDPVAREYVMRRELLPQALSDLTILHAVLCLSGMHYMTLSGQRDGYTQTLSHRGEALRLLNQSLRDPSFEVDSNTVTAILLLSGNEMLAGEGNSLQNHLHGLMVMVKAQGGLEAPGIHRTVAELLIWMDQLCHVSSGCSLKFQLSQTSSIYLAMQTSISQKPTSFPRVSITATRFRSLSCLDAYTSQILTDIIGTYRFLACKPSRADGVFFNHMRAWISRRLAIDDARDGGKYRQRSATPIRECIRLAALIHSNLALRGLPVMCTVHTRIARKVRDLLLPFLFSPAALAVDVAVKEVCLWIAFVAGSTLMEMPTLREWYVRLIRELLTELGIMRGDWIGIKEILMGFLWEKDLWEPVLRRVWEEVKRPGLETAKIEELDFELDLVSD